MLFFSLLCFVEAARIGSYARRSIPSRQTVYANLEMVTDIFYPSKWDVQNSHLILYQGDYPKVTYLSIPREVRVNQGETAVIIRTKRGNASITELVKEYLDKSFRDLHPRLDQHQIEYQVIMFTGRELEKVNLYHRFVRESYIIGFIVTIIATTLFYKFGY